MIIDKMLLELWHYRIIWYLFEGFKTVIVCSVHSVRFMKFVFCAKIWFVKTSTRIVKYESHVATSNPGFLHNSQGGCWNSTYAWTSERYLYFVWEWQDERKVWTRIIIFAFLPLTFRNDFHTMTSAREEENGMHSEDIVAFPFNIHSCFYCRISSDFCEIFLWTSPLCQRGY